MHTVNQERTRRAHLAAIGIAVCVAITGRCVNVIMDAYHEAEDDCAAAELAARDQDVDDAGEHVEQPWHGAGHRHGPHCRR